MKARELLTAKHASTLFTIVLLIFYVFAPISIYFFANPDPLYLKTAALALVAALGIIAGKSIPTVAVQNKARKIYINNKKFISSVFIFFSIFILITTITADTIPLISAFEGLSAEDLSNERGSFLKGREGFWIVLLYISSILTSTIIPYTTILAYKYKSIFSKTMTATFFIYSAIFLVKALFLSLLLPIISYAAEKNPKNFSKILLMISIAFFVLLFMIWISGFGSLEIDIQQDKSTYFSTEYIPTGVVDYFVYRTFSVPVFSVVDTLHVHQTQFGGNLLLGNTSSFLSQILGNEKINIERYVAEYQYGGWNDFANSNVVFFVDGYVNFGWLGVLFFGVIVGRIYKVFMKSEDVAFRALSLLFSYQLFASPLIQMLLSNGWLALIIIVSALKLTRLKRKDMNLPLNDRIGGIPQN